MNSLYKRGAALVAAIFCLCAAPALAAGPFTFVSGTGVDAGTCSTPATACRTFAFAQTQTTPGGEIRALNAASYGPLFITQSIKLIGVPGAGITKGLAGPLITVNTPASARVEITGLILDGNVAMVAGAYTRGVELLQGGDLTIRDCLIRNHLGPGVRIYTTAASRVLIENTTVEGVDSASISISGAAASVIATLNKVTVTHGGYEGVFIHGANAIVGITNSVVSNNRANGIALVGGSLVRLSRSVSMNNGGYGVNVFNGTAESAGDNFIHGNGHGQIVGTLTNVGRH